MGSQAFRRASARGAAAVEFALVMLPLLYLIYGGIAYAYMFSFRQAMSQSASEGARAAVGIYAPTDATCASTGPFSATTCPAQYAAAQAVKGALNTYDMACNSDHLTCTIKVGTSTTISQCAAGHTCVSVQVTYPYQEHSLLPTIPGYGFILPDDLAFTSVVQLS